MKIEIITKNIKNDSMVRQYIQRKVHFALDRIDARVESVTVRLEDEKAKTDAIFDGACRIDVEITPKGHIHVSAKGESTFDCVLQAVRKMEHAVKHDIDRHRSSSRARHQQAKRLVNESLEDFDSVQEIIND